MIDTTLRYSFNEKGFTDAPAGHMGQIKPVAQRKTILPLLHFQVACSL